MLCIMADSGMAFTRLVLLVFTPRAVILSSCRQARMLGISAGMEPKGSHADYFGSGMCVAGFPGDDISRCVPFCGRHAQDTRHLGRYGPEGHHVARRLFRQWHVQGWFAGYVAPRVVFP